MFQRVDGAGRVRASGPICPVCALVHRGAVCVVVAGVSVSEPTRGLLLEIHA